MRKLIMLATLSLPAVPALAAQPAPSSRETHTAECVAALEVSTDALAEQVKAGVADLRPLLRHRLDAGAAFIGDAYVRGDRDEERSRALLSAAINRQKSLSDVELNARQEACAAEGARILAKSNALSRAVVSRIAEKRMKKLLGE